MAFSTGGREILKAVLKDTGRKTPFNARTLWRGRGGATQPHRDLLAGRTDGAEVAEYCECRKQRKARLAGNRTVELASGLPRHGQEEPLGRELTGQAHGTHVADLNEVAVAEAGGPVVHVNWGWEG